MDGLFAGGGVFLDRKLFLSLKHANSVVNLARESTRISHKVLVSQDIRNVLSRLNDFIYSKCLFVFHDHVSDDEFTDAGVHH